jgi:hypothetical protein
MEFRPQKGFQEDFLKCSADIVIGGGAAGVGKTWAELIEPLRHLKIPDFRCTIFRRTYPEIKKQGGLWDESKKIYPYFGAKPNETELKWRFPSGMEIVFNNIQYEKDLIDYQGSQIALIQFDELTHFTKRMFLYMLSRNRSVSGVKPYVRATCNPDAESFVADLIEYWIDDDGFIIPERCGKFKYFILDQDEFIFGDTKDEVIEKCPHRFPTKDYNLVKSFTFIEGDIYDNKILLKKNPEYLANLMSLPEEDRMRLLEKNWKIKSTASNLINYDRFQDVYTNDFVDGIQNYITADIATKGSNLLVIGVWKGKRLIDLGILNKNDGKAAIDKILELKNKYLIPSSNICFDADGIGGGLTGFIPGAIEFHNGRRPIGRANYDNLKTQCYYNLADCINRSANKTNEDYYYLTPDVVNSHYEFQTPKVYKDKTIKWIFNHQLKAIKRDKMDLDGKLKLINKEKMKNILQDISPDFLDMMMMREYFEITNDFWEEDIEAY